MNDDDLVGLLLMVGILIVLVFAVLATTAGNIVNQLLSPVPSIAGPLGAAVSLIVFVYLLIKLLELFK